MPRQNTAEIKESLIELVLEARAEIQDGTQLSWVESYLHRAAKKLGEININQVEIDKYLAKQAKKKDKETNQ